MTRDFRRAHGYRPRAQIPGWLWFISGIGVGLLIAFLIYLKRDEFLAPEPTAQREAPAAIDVPAEQPGVAAPRFDFYTILPDQEIVVPDTEAREPVTIKEAKEIPETREPAPAKVEKPAKPATAAAPKPATPKSANAASASPATTAGKGTYVLQVGSFKRMDEADRLKAALALIGIESSIQVVQLKEGDNWHRVRVGPFDDMARVTETRARLKKNKFPSIVLQVKS
jgi:cell division protein FtsN